jgi:hypothetical protein
MSSKIDTRPGELDLVLYAGDVGDFRIVFKDKYGVSVPVSSYKWTSQIRKSRTSVDYITLEVDVKDAGIGILLVKIPGSITRQMSQSGWNKLSQWDIQATTLDDSMTVTVLQGEVSCELDVTK